MKLIAWMFAGALTGIATLVGLARMAYAFDRMARLERFEEYVSAEAESWTPA